VLVEQRGVEELLLLESQVLNTAPDINNPPNIAPNIAPIVQHCTSQAILTLTPAEAEPLKRSYVKLCDAYGILGNLRLNVGEGVLHYLALVTGCVSVGKLGQAEVYRMTGVKMYSLRGYQPDEERVAEMTKLLTSGAAYFSWSHQVCLGHLLIPGLLGD
jgi:hypothetical protein